jgi:hypothetical protein
MHLVTDEVGPALGSLGVLDVSEAGVEEQLVVLDALSSADDKLVTR